MLDLKDVFKSGLSYELGDGLLIDFGLIDGVVAHRSSHAFLTFILTLTLKRCESVIVSLSSDRGGERF